jgi:carboxypeptidase D
MSNWSIAHFRAYQVYRVEFPVGTGFSFGNVTATTEEEVAQDFVGFFKNWETIFGIKNFKIFATGESYAGRYVPYVSAAMLDQKDKTYFDMSGAITYDPCIGISQNLFNK